MAADTLPDDWEEAPGVDDWEEAPAVEAQPVAVDRSSAGSAAVHGLANTFGTGDVLGAGFQAYLKGASNLPELVTGDLSPLENARSILAEYKKARAENRYVTKRDKETQPGAYYGGQIAGAISTAPLLPARTLPAALAIGGTQGLVEGAAISEADSAGGVLQDAAVGGALGAAGGGLGYGLGKGMEWAGKRIPAAAASAKEWLENTAAVQALKASGAIKKDLTSIAQRDPGRIREMGRSILDEEVIRPFMGVEQVEQGLSAARSEVGDAMGDVLRQVDDTGASFDMNRFLARAEKEIIHPNIDDPAVAGEIDAVRSLLDAYHDVAQAGPVGFQWANHLKSSLQNAQINWGNHWNQNGPSKYLEQFKMALQGIFKDEIDTQLGEAASPAVRATFEGLKRRFGPLAFATDRARQGVAREMGNNALGLKDMQAAQMGLQSALSSGQATPTGLMMAAGAAATNKYLTGRGSSAAAVAADRLASSDWLQTLVASNPHALGQYGGMLASALARGPAAMAVTDYVLSQRDPAYRETKEAAQKAAQGER